jgi:hypothetical protein
MRSRRAALRHPDAPALPWIIGMKARRKRPMVIAVALANKIWAMNRMRIARGSVLSVA